MQSKQIVAIGIFISTLFATLILFEWIPPLVAAFVVLGTTLTATFFIALSLLRGRRLMDQEFVSRAVQRIHEEKSPREIIEQILHWSKATVECEDSFFYQIDEQDDIQEMIEWQEISKELADGRQSHRWPSAPVRSRVPAAAKSFLAFPVGNNEQQCPQGILYLVNRRGSREFSRLDESLIHTLVRAGATALNHFQNEEQNLGFYQQIIACLIKGMETQSPGFEGHAERVSLLAVRLGLILGFNPRETQVLKMAALLHDAGKIIPDEEVREETTRSEMGDKHPEKGARLFPEEESFQALREGILYHHERYNGSGFPEGLRLADIPLIAGIIAVADVYDALTCLNEEEARMSGQEAFVVIKKATGTLFDPMVVVALEELLPVLLAPGE